jgi:hypothetical protein
MSQYTRGIDLKYRPSSYFWASERGIALISDIKGAERRKPNTAATHSMAVAAAQASYRSRSGN